MTVEEAIKEIRERDELCQFLREEPHTPIEEAAIVLLAAYDQREAVVTAAIAWEKWEGGLLQKRTTTDLLIQAIRALGQEPS